jgi:ActR/RegA family two-component response regulator
MTIFRSGNPELSVQMLGPWGQAHLRVKLALKESQGNIAEASRRLGVSERTLYRWMVAHPELQREAEKMRDEANR